ncbi:hypothetical protein D3C76_1748700 [compost metagenome]
MINCGIITAGYGIIKAVSNKRKMTFLPGNFSLAKEKAAKLDVRVPTTVTERAMMTLFLIPLSSGPAVQISAYLPH